MKNKKLKVKYTGPALNKKIRYGLFNDMADWVRYSKEEYKEGCPLVFLMSYDDYTGRENNPILKEIDYEDQTKKIYQIGEKRLSDLEKDF